MTAKEKHFNYAEEARNELRDEGYREYWCVIDKGVGAERIISYFTNGAGKIVLLVETQFNKNDRCSWDLYRPLTGSPNVAETFAALKMYTESTI